MMIEGGFRMDLKLHLATYHIPGGERDALWAYDDISDLIHGQKNAFSVERLWNRADGRWFLVLIGSVPDPVILSQIEQVLAQVQARPVTLPPEQVARIVLRYLAREEEALTSGKTWIERHHPRRQTKDQQKRKD
jgi:hypothetical protein